MIVHQAEGMHQPVVSFDHQVQDIDKGFPVQPVTEYIGPGVAPGGDMIDRSRVFYA